MMRFALRVLLLAASFAIGTWVLGWWAIPLFAALAGVLARHVPRQALAAALAAMVAWGALLIWSLASGSGWSYATTVGATVGVAGVALILLTVIFPAVLAWLAALLGQILARGPA
ncbi:MAG: hypothetical protein ACT4PJ_02495 [Gemmatimonadaceae bacterium]